VKAISNHNSNNTETKYNWISINYPTKNAEFQAHLDEDAPEILASNSQVAINQ